MRNFARHLFSRLVFVWIVLFAATCMGSSATQPDTHRFAIQDNQFVLDGKPFQIISGEMHYARIPREYWRDRLKMARAMGLNTISTYVFWNLHEQQQGVYDFSGQLDVSTFIRMAQEEGLFVILRPGPYACAEWELGGYPAWLLATPDIVLRSTDERSMRPTEKWIARLGRELAALQAGRGGPIIAVQVENEYGSFDSDKAYMRRIHSALQNAGFTDALLYTADGPDQLRDGTLPDVPAVVNIDPGSTKTGLAKLKTFRPGAPLMIGEFWAGWFDHWGREHHITNGESEAKELEWALKHDSSINIYMFHGGTSFGFMNGANIDGGFYWADVSSYDYDAPLDESGRPTSKYFLFRDVIQKHTGHRLPEIPTVPATIAIPEFRLDETGRLTANLPKRITTEKPRSMESFGQSCGYILYRTGVPGPIADDLVVHDVQDYAQVYINNRLAGTIDRRLKQDRLAIRTNDRKATLDILVENSGRVNYTKAIRDERKGITSSVTLAGKELTGWQVYTLPMSDVSAVRFAKQAVTGAAFYRGTFQLSQTGDTFLDFSNWSKGTVWVNGHQLGRFWNVGPQQTLYVPGPWLRKGSNTVVVFDLDPQPTPVLKGLKQPILNDLREPHPSKTKQN